MYFQVILGGLGYDPCQYFSTRELLQQQRIKTGIKSPISIVLKKRQCLLSSHEGDEDEEEDEDEDED